MCRLPVTLTSNQTSFAGRTLPRAPGPSVLRRRMDHLGSKDYNPSWIVCLSNPHAPVILIHIRSYRYVLSVILKRLITFKCNLPVLRLTPLLTLLALPFALTRLLCYHKRLRPPASFFTPTAESVVLSAFPVVWFFGFLYYTDVPSVLFVVASITAATELRHWTAALVSHRDAYTRQRSIIRKFGSSG